jgi:Mlc titration factor MtfA (ptsG expression regulator)
METKKIKKLEDRGILNWEQASELIHIDTYNVDLSELKNKLDALGFELYGADGFDSKKIANWTNSQEEDVVFLGQYDGEEMLDEDGDPIIIDGDGLFAILK